MRVLCAFGTPIPRPEPLLPSLTRTALVVDDDATLRYVLARLARLAGYEILEANTGSIAFEVATAKSPDVIVADVRLPDFDGFELCKRLKSDKATKPIPVVLVTSMYYETARNAGLIAEGKKKAQQSGAMDLLPRGEALHTLQPLLENLVASARRQKAAKRR
jgi:CheY-like chemotaxis protein